MNDISTRRSIAAMTKADIPEVAALFFRAFRAPGSMPAPEFLAYLEASFFGSPSYDPAVGGLVHRAPDGHLDGALAVVPMKVSVNGRILTGRLMSNYMTDPGRRTRGGADMVLTLRSRNQEFCFSDSANPVSADHWKAVGGMVLPIQSLDWRRIFRPAAWLLSRVAPRLPATLVATLPMMAKPLDAVFRRAMPGLVPAISVQGRTMTRADFVATAPGLVSRFALHPVWESDELNWLLDMAALNKVDGPLSLHAAYGPEGELLGCSVFYARPGGVARVLNILARRGAETPVVANLLHHLDAMGCIAAAGMAQPFLMQALGRQKGIAFVPRGAYCISTRHADIIDAAARGDVYLGGLMGEDWSRLVTDFYP
jgi:hypothetical protein